MCYISPVMKSAFAQFVFLTTDALRKWNRARSIVYRVKDGRRVWVHFERGGKTLCISDGNRTERNPVFLTDLFYHDNGEVEVAHKLSGGFHWVLKLHDKKTGAPLNKMQEVIDGGLADWDRR